MIDPRCEGCTRIVVGHPHRDFTSCACYLWPEAVWRLPGGCQMATNRVKAAVYEKKARVGQQKQKKVKKR